MKGRQRRETLQAFAFLAPSFIVLLVFGILPVFYAFYVSLHRWRVSRDYFLGLENYLALLGQPADILWTASGVGLLLAAWLVWRCARPGQSNANWGLRLGAAAFVLGSWLLLTGFPQMYAHGDEKLFKSLVVTGFYALGTVPFQLTFGLLLALLLSQDVRGRAVWRVIYLLPYVTPPVASAAMWMALFEPRRGLVNAILSGLGAPEEALPQWLWEATGVNQSIVDALGLHVELPWALAGPGLALLVVMVCNVWVFSGYNAVLFLAGLGNIPHQVYEAARIDGAGRWSTFRRVTLPLLAPTTFFLTMMGIINACQSVNHIYVMTQQVGLTEPQFSTAANTIYILDQFQRSSRYGYASAMAFILFGLVLALSRLQDRAQGKRVHHG